MKTSPAHPPAEQAARHEADLPGGADANSKYEYQRLGFLIHDVARLRRTVFDDQMKPLGVTRAQWSVLAHLSRHDGMIQSDLAGLMDLGKPTLGGLIDRVEALGLVYRRADATDKRVKRVFLSPKGTKIVKELIASNIEISERSLEGFGAEDRAHLNRLLLQLKRNLKTMKGDGARPADA